MEVGLDNLNRAMSAWMRGNLPPELEEALYEAKGHKDSLVWNRNWGRDSVNMRSYQLRLARGEMRDILEQASLEAGAPVNRIVVVRPRHAVTRPSPIMRSDPRPPSLTA